LSTTKQFTQHPDARKQVQDSSSFAFVNVLPDHLLGKVPSSSSSSSVPVDDLDSMFGTGRDLETRGSKGSVQNNVQDESMGIKFLRGMGWKGGQTIGILLRKPPPDDSQAPSNKKRRVMGPSLEDLTGEEVETKSSVSVDTSEQATFFRRKERIDRELLSVEKQRSHAKSTDDPTSGLGYKPQSLESPSGPDQATDGSGRVPAKSLFRKPKSKSVRSSFSSVVPTGSSSSSSSGAASDGSYDPFEYDVEIGGEEEKKKTQEKDRIDHREQGGVSFTAASPHCTTLHILFSDRLSTLFPRPSVPSDYVPVHKTISTSISSSSTTAGGHQHKITAEERGKKLGEEQLPRAPVPISKEDHERGMKEQRYRAFISGENVPWPRSFSEEQKQEESKEFRERFEKWRQLPSMMSSRFTKSSTSSLPTTPSSSSSSQISLSTSTSLPAGLFVPPKFVAPVVVEKAPEPIPVPASNKTVMTFTKDWFPERLLCKRFGVTDPHPNRHLKAEAAMGSYFGLDRGLVASPDTFLPTSFVASSAKEGEDAPYDPFQEDDDDDDGGISAKKKDVISQTREEEEQEEEIVPIEKPSSALFKAIFEDSDDE
jgi:hypothetical protein